jgi:hypothetical protein
MAQGTASSCPTFDEAAACTQLVHLWLLALMLKQALVLSLQSPWMLEPLLAD